MKSRNNFISQIKSISKYDLSKKQNYRISKFENVSDYIKYLILKEMEHNKIAISNTGDLKKSYLCDDEKGLYPFYILLNEIDNTYEICYFNDMQERINILVNDIIYK